MRKLKLLVLAGELAQGGRQVGVDLGPGGGADVADQLVAVAAAPQVAGVDLHLERAGRPLADAGGDIILRDVFIHRVVDRIADHLPDDTLHVAPFERERNGLGLDGSGGDVVFVTKRSRDHVGEAEILEGGQKGGVFHKAVCAPARMPGAGVSGAPACLGSRFVS